MDLAALIVNLGLFVVSAAAAAFAWVQANQAERAKDDAEAAQKRAVVAQEAAASALAEANTIAGEARDLLAGREARATERHRVGWRPRWDFDGVWILTNEGPDTAHRVRLSVDSGTIGRRDVEAASVAKDETLNVEIPAYKGTGGVPRVSWQIDWESELGVGHMAQGSWPPR